MTKITRRAVLAAIPAAAAVTAVPALAGAIDPHVAWERELHALQVSARELWAAVPNDPALSSSDIEVRREAIDRLGIRDAEERAVQVDFESFAVEKKIGATQAQTAAGLLVQARLLAARVPLGGGSVCTNPADAALAANMLASIERMAGERS